MKVDDITPGLHVRVHTLSSTAGMLINPKHLEVRREGATGYVRGFVAGHGGDVWWVEHSDRLDEIAAYSFHEIEPHPEPAKAPEPDSILD